MNGHLIFKKVIYVRLFSRSLLAKSQVTARFIGTNSCGFINGFVYTLNIVTDNRNQYVWVVDRKLGLSCPYSSINALAKNWEIPVAGDILLGDVSPIGNQ